MPLPERAVVIFVANLGLCPYDSEAAQTVISPSTSQIRAVGSNIGGERDDMRDLPWR
jgi:hypothetical protein